MEKKIGLGIITGAIALVVAIVGTTVAFAAYNESLTIKGSGTAKATRWSIIFKDLGNVQTGNNGGVTSTAREVTAPSIVGDTSIETYSVELKTPGDYVTYNFKIKNAGDFPAKIDSGFTMPTPTCIQGANGKADDATNVCGNLTYSLKYVIGGADVSVNDTFAVGEEKEVQLKIYYNKNATTAQLPTDDVAIGNLNITIPFVQY